MFDDFPLSLSAFFLPGLVLGLGCGILLTLVLMGLRIWRIYFRANQAHLSLTMSQIVRMWMGQVDALLVLDAYINVHCADLDVPLSKLINLNMAHGHVDQVVMALIAAHHAHHPLTFDQLSAVDLVGQDVIAFVQDRIKPGLFANPPTQLGIAIGAKGQLLTEVYPLGKARFGNLAVSAVSQKTKYPAGIEVVSLFIEGSTVTVGLPSGSLTVVT